MCTKVERMLWSNNQRYLDKKIIPKAFQKQQKKNGHALFIPHCRSDQERTSTRHSITWPDKYYVVPRLCSDLS